MGSNVGTVRNCFALNSEVAATDNTTGVGRVVGNISIDGELSNNYARATGMTLKNGSGNVTIPAAENNLTSKHGFGVSVLTNGATYSASYWRDNVKFNANLWDLADLSTTRLPWLKTTTGGKFSEMQNPTLP